MDCLWHASFGHGEAAVRGLATRASRIHCRVDLSVRGGSDSRSSYGARWTAKLTCGRIHKPAWRSLWEESDAHLTRGRFLMCSRKPSHSFQARIRGIHRRTFLQYASYSAPNIFRSVGSSYINTNKTTPSATTHATAMATRFARPKTTHSPTHPAKNPMYMGFRTYR